MKNSPIFISYSRRDGKDFALKLRDMLENTPVPMAIWLDENDIQIGGVWEQNIVEAIRACRAFVFVMTEDSTTYESFCYNECSQAIKYKKPIVPLQVHAPIEVPMSVDKYQRLDFTTDFDAGFSRLVEHLIRLETPEGILETTRTRMRIAERDLRYATDDLNKRRIEAEIEQLKQEIANQENILRHHGRSTSELEQDILTNIGDEFAIPVSPPHLKTVPVVNKPPVTVGLFQDRFAETLRVGKFLTDDKLRIATILGRGGAGKTTMVCRLLKSLETTGQLPDDDPEEIPLDGIVYLSANAFQISVTSIFLGLCKLLPPTIGQRLERVYRDPQISLENKMRALLAEFQGNPTVLLLDNFEDVIDSETRQMADKELDEVLRYLLTLPHHSIKTIITTRVLPRELLLVERTQQETIELGAGLETPYAEELLCQLDGDGILGLKDTPIEILTAAKDLTLGLPRALEEFYAVLYADRATSLEELLEEKIMPDKVVEVLVGEAFSRLDNTAQKVMQALAIYRRPVTKDAVSYLLHPYLPGLNTTQTLSFLVTSHLVHKDRRHYYLHEADRDYAFQRIPETGTPDGDVPPFTRHALLQRGADYFKLARKDQIEWRTLDDLAPHLAELELRSRAGDCDQAISILFEIEPTIFTWGYYSELVEWHKDFAGTLTGQGLEQRRLGNLGRCLFHMGNLGESINYLNQATQLAQQTGSEEGSSQLYNYIGNAYHRLAQLDRSIEWYQKAVDIARKTNDKTTEAMSLSGIGNSYQGKGEIEYSATFYEQALAMSRQLGNREEQSRNLRGMTEIAIAREEYVQAIQYALESKKIADEIASPRRAALASEVLSYAYFCANDMSAARHAAEDGREYDYSYSNHVLSTFLGVIALVQDDHEIAIDAFRTAIAQTEEFLRHNPNYVNAMDAKALALCGLTICKQNPAYVQDAIRLFQQARAMSPETPISTSGGIWSIGWTLQKLRAIMQLDTNGLLSEVQSFWNELIPFP